MNYFLLDASAMAKRFCLERGSTLIDHLFASVSKTRLACCMLGAIEVVAALIRKRNAGVISAPLVASAIARLVNEVLDAAHFIKYPADNGLVRSAVGLLATHSINSSDAVLLQLAMDVAAYERSQSNEVVLVASDQRLLKAAQSEGIQTFDPEVQTQTELEALIGS